MKFRVGGRFHDELKSTGAELVHVVPGENVEHAGRDVAEVPDHHVRVVREASVHQPKSLGFRVYG